MKKKYLLIAGVLCLFLVGTGILVYRSLYPPEAPRVVEEEPQESIPPADPSITVALAWKKGEDNTVTLSVENLDSKYAFVAYELTYESGGLIKGVNSGSKPIDVSGESSFERDVYFGTCSRNVCKPDPGVTKVSVVLEFTDTDGNKTQFSKEFDLS
jgi:hypothetical protein